MKKRNRFMSILLAAVIIVSAFATTVLTANAATAGSQVYFDNSVYNWDKVYVYAYGTKENAKWPGQLMEKDESGLYTKTFTAVFKSENIIFNNGLEEEEGKEQYPEANGLPLKTGQCKLLTTGLQWVDYGKPDDHGYGYSYTASGTTFSDNYFSVRLGLKNASKGWYSIDGSPKKEYKNDDFIDIGEGKIGNSTITLTLTAKGSDGVETEQVFTYKKTFTASTTSFSAQSDGHTTEPETGYYGTNPNMQLGKNKTITVDGKLDDWDSSMIIAQGTANDDPRVYMPSSMHEQPWDAYALYAAWDDDNLYFMWELANTTYIVSPSDNFAASNEARPWRNSIPMYIALSIDPEKQATGKAVGTNKDGSTYTNPYVWGCDGGYAKDGGVGFTTHVDTLIALDSNNSNGGASIFKADTLDTDGTYMFNYDTRVPIGVRSFEAQDNQNGFKIKYANGTLSNTMYGIRGAKGTRVLGDNTDSGSNWVDFYDLGYKKSYGYIYEVAIPLEHLGIDKEYIETKGIGAMQILTYGTSGMDTLPHDPSMLDKANVAYSYDPSTSKEKEDIDNITVPLARVGALLEDTVINEAKFQVNFGADKSSEQSVNTEIKLMAESYNASGEVEYEFFINGNSVQKSSDSVYKWIPDETGIYEISVIATDSQNNTCNAFSAYTIVEAEKEPEYMVGDVNKDGYLDVKDVTQLQMFLAKYKNSDGTPLLDEANPQDFAIADFNANNIIDVADVTEIQMFLATNKV